MCSATSIISFVLLCYFALFFHYLNSSCTNKTCYSVKFCQVSRNIFTKKTFDRCFEISFCIHWSIHHSITILPTNMHILFWVMFGPFIICFKELCLLDSAWCQALCTYPLKYFAINLVLSLAKHHLCRCSRSSKYS